MFRGIQRNFSFGYPYHVVVFHNLYVLRYRVRSLLATGAGGLIAAGTDAAIRAWAPATPATSYLVAAPPPPPSAAPLTDEVNVAPLLAGFLRCDLVASSVVRCIW